MGEFIAICAKIWADVFGGDPEDVWGWERSLGPAVYESQQQKEAGFFPGFRSEHKLRGSSDL